MANQQKQVRESLAPNRLRKDHIWVPRYATDQEIFGLYYRTQRDHEELDPIVAALTDDALMDMMADWDPNATAEA